MVRNKDIARRKRYEDRIWKIKVRMNITNKKENYRNRGKHKSESRKEDGKEVENKHRSRNRN